VFFASNWAGGECTAQRRPARRRLAAKAKGMGRRVLPEVATIVTPDIAQKYGGRGKHGAGRPRTRGEIEALVVRMAGILKRHGVEPAPKQAPVVRRHRPFKLRVKVYCGDTAVLTARMRMHGTNPSGPFDDQILMIHVWVKSNGAWQLAVHQTTKLQ
jgi:hypothetical protein